MRKLLDAAMVVFAKRGYHAARVDDIVKVARTSHGTFYLYFSNKEDLLRALVGEAGTVVAALDDALGPIDPGPEGWYELRDWIEQFSAAWQRYAPVLRAWPDLVMSDAELSVQAHAAAGGVAVALARRATEAGPLPGIDPNAAAEAVIAMVDRFHYLRQFAGEPIDAVALDTLATIVHRALFAGSGPPAGHQPDTARPRPVGTARTNTSGAPGATARPDAGRAATTTAKARRSGTGRAGATNRRATSAAAGRPDATGEGTRQHARAEGPTVEGSTRPGAGSTPRTSRSTNAGGRRRQ